jgi:hypothetical protein
MDLTAWFGSQGVFSTGAAAHIFGSGSVPDSNLQSLSRTTNFVRREVFRAEVLFSSAMPTHADKHTGWGGGVDCFL